KEEDRLRKAAEERIARLTEQAAKDIERVKDDTKTVKFIEDSLAEAIRRINEQLAGDLKALEESQVQEKEGLYREWLGRLIELSATGEGLLKRRGDEGIRQIEEEAAKAIQAAEADSELIQLIERSKAAQILHINEEL